MTGININILSNPDDFTGAAAGLALAARIGAQLEANNTLEVADAAREYVRTLKAQRASYDTPTSHEERWAIACEHAEAKRYLFEAVEKADR
jgi:hypothetical protein